MFTGIIENTGEVISISQNGSNVSFWISSDISSQLTVDQSVSHDGVCLTVEEVLDNKHRVTAIDETLKKTTLCVWQPGKIINLERCMSMNKLLDGHIVQGHVDGKAMCNEKIIKDGSIEFSFSFENQFAPLVIEKGSICLNGTSLTAFNVGKNQFTVAIIPYTLNHTNFQFLEKGDFVNIEFDVLGKYVQRMMDLKSID